MPSIGNFLQSVTNTGIQVKDFAHASRLYADNVFALAPKAGWLYYVVFDVEPSAITDKQWANQQRVSEVGMLVKSADLPKFNVQTEVVNQYNRKTVIQKGITYNPVSLSLHDDQSNVVHNMWLNYYRYYYADSTWGGTGPIGTAKENTPGAYQNNKYLPSTDLFNPVNYGLNSRLTVAPFFRSITIYQLNRKLFTSYKLVNPIISAWEHDRVDQTQGNRPAESKMTVNYEAVFYGVGQVKKDTPTGFAVFHYDTSPSPLSLAGGGNNSLFGPGGVIPGALEIFGDVSNILNPDSKVGPLGVLGTVIKGASLVRNVKGITRDSLRAEGYKILEGTLRNISQGGLNGLGVNLNLQKGNNFATAGQFLGTPVAVVTAAAIGQEFGPGGTTTQTPAVNGTPPTSATGSVIGANTRSLAQGAAAVGATQLGGSTDDSDPAGDTVAQGTYFSPVELPLNNQPFEKPDIDENSAVEDVDLALEELRSGWASDNDFIAGQQPNPDEVSVKLNDAASTQEHAAIKADADRAFSSAQTAQAAVDSKYRAEFNRLTALKQQIQTQTSASGNVQSGNDSSSSEPSPESSSAQLPDIEF
jgi:hypothetical protein